MLFLEPVYVLEHKYWIAKLISTNKIFKNKKEELICLLEKLCNYQEINFDENIKSEIISWELGKFETQEALSDWSKRFSEYICTLDII